MKKILENLSWNLFGKFFRITLNVIVLAKIVGFIGYEKFGWITILLTYQSYFAIISTLGVEVNYGKDFVKKNYSNIFTTVICVKFVITFFTIFILGLVGVDSLILLSILAGGLSALNLIDIQLSASHSHKNFIKISIITSILSFAVKMLLIEVFRNESVLFYFLLLENFFISFWYLLTSDFRLRLKVNTQYLKIMLKHAVQFIAQRSLYILSTTLILILFQNKIEPNEFGEVAVSFKIVGFCYIIFAALTSSFEKSIFGKSNKLHGFCFMYRSILFFYLGLIVLFFIAMQISTISMYTSNNIYFRPENYLAIVLSAPYFLLVAINKWYILNRQYKIISLSHITILSSTIIVTFLLNEASQFVFWLVWANCFTLGIIAGFILDGNRHRHFKILRRSLWPL